MTESIQLRTNAHPSLQNVIVVAEFGLTQSLTVFLTRFDDGHGIGAGWESRCFGIGLNRHGHFFTLLDQLGGSQNIVFGDVVQSTELVASTPLGFVATFIREGTAHGQSTQ